METILGLLINVTSNLMQDTFQGGWIFKLPLFAILMESFLAFLSLPAVVYAFHMLQYFTIIGVLLVYGLMFYLKVTWVPFFYTVYFLAVGTEDIVLHVILLSLLFFESFRSLINNVTWFIRKRDARMNLIRIMASNAATVASNHSITYYKSVIGHEYRSLVQFLMLFIISCLPGLVGVVLLTFLIIARYRKKIGNFVFESLVDPPKQIQFVKEKQVWSPLVISDPDVNKHKTPDEVIENIPRGANSDAQLMRKAMAYDYSQPLVFDEELTQEERMARDALHVNWADSMPESLGGDNVCTPVPVIPKMKRMESMKAGSIKYPLENLSKYQLAVEVDGKHVGYAFNTVSGLYMPQHVYNTAKQISAGRGIDIINEHVHHKLCMEPVFVATVIDPLCWFEVVLSMFPVIPKNKFGSVGDRCMLLSQGNLSSGTCRVEDDIFLHRASTLNGDSGSLIWCNGKIAGIHMAGGDHENAAVPIDEMLISQFFRIARGTTASAATSQVQTRNPKSESAPRYCTYCRKYGHSLNNCWQRNGKRTPFSGSSAPAST